MCHTSYLEVQCDQTAEPIGPLSIGHLEAGALEASLVHQGSSMTARVTERNPVSIKQNNKTKQKDLGSTVCQVGWPPGRTCIFSSES